MDRELVHLSKFLSRVLRHSPQMIGLALDSGGWAGVDALLASMRARGMLVDQAKLERVVTENDKQRFSFSEDGTKIRANQGHSIPVDLVLRRARRPSCSITARR